MDESNEQYLQQKISMIQQESMRVKQENGNERDKEINDLKQKYGAKIKDLNGKINELKQKCDSKITILCQKYESKNIEIDEKMKKKIKRLEAEYKMNLNQSSISNASSSINIGVNDDIYNEISSLSQQQHSNNIMTQKCDKKRRRHSMNHRDHHQVPPRKKRKRNSTHDIIKEIPGSMKRNRIYPSQKSMKSLKRKRRKTIISDNQSHDSYDGDIEYDMTTSPKTMLLLQSERRKNKNPRKSRMRQSLRFTKVEGTPHCNLIK